MYLRKVKEENCSLIKLNRLKLIHRTCHNNARVTCLNRLEFDIDNAGAAGCWSALSDVNHISCSRCTCSCIFSKMLRCIGVSGRRNVFCV